MKVQFKEAKKYITVAEMPTVRQIIEDLKNDETSVKEYAEMAVRAITQNNVVTVLDASAEIAKNDRVWNRYTDDSGHLDVWITFTAMVGTIGLDGFVMGGACLSDIWDLRGWDDRETVSHMYVRQFKEVR